MSTMIEANLYPEHSHTRADRVVTWYRRWHGLERDVLKSGIEVIDSDVSGVEMRQHLRPYNDRSEAAWALKRDVLPLLSGAEELPVLDQRRTLLAELNAADTFLASLGHPVELDHYIRQTMGIGLRYFSDDKIKEAKEQVQDALARVGYKDRNTARAFTEFRNDHIQDPVTFQDGMVAVIERDFPKMQEFLGLEGLDNRFNSPAGLVVFREEPDSPYRMEAYFRGEPALKVNTAKAFFKGDEQYFAYHEYMTHLVDLAMLAAKIGRGEVIEDLGISTMFGRGFKDEGLAQTLPEFMPDVLQPDGFGKLAYLWRELREYVFNNTHIKVNTLNVALNPDEDVRTSVEDAAREVKGQLRGILTEDEIDGEIMSRLESELSRTNLYVYGRSLDEFKRISRRLSTDEQRRTFLSESLGTPLTPRQVSALVEIVAPVAV